MVTWKLFADLLRGVISMLSTGVEELVYSCDEGVVLGGDAVVSDCHRRWAILLATASYFFQEKKLNVSACFCCY